MPLTGSNCEPFLKYSVFDRQSTSGFIISSQSLPRISWMPSIIGTAVKESRQGVVPIHTNTRGAIPVETIVSPLANSKAEYAPTKCSGGRQRNRSLMNDLLAPLSTNAGTLVPFTRAVPPEARGPVLQCLGLGSPQHRQLERSPSSHLAPWGSLPRWLETLKRLHPLGAV